VEPVACNKLCPKASRVGSHVELVVVDPSSAVCSIRKCYSFPVKIEPRRQSRNEISRRDPRLRVLNPGIESCDVCTSSSPFDSLVELLIYVFRQLQTPSIKRCIVNTQVISQDFLVQDFGTMSPEWAVDRLRELLVDNPMQNVRIVVQVAGTYWKEFGIGTLIALFHATNLAQVVNACEDPDIHLRYIEAATKLGHFQGVKRMCSASRFIPAGASTTTWCSKTSPTAFR